jgi:Ca2+-binding EF-hand superfamily protein
MSRSSLMISLALAGSFASMAAGAVPGELRRPADRNGDGLVSVAEAKAEASARLREIDANRDGVLTREEFRTYRAQARSNRQAMRFEAIDADRDGRISEAELDAHLHAMVDRRSDRRFAAIDADGNREITRQEFDAAPERLRERARDAGFARLDANGDGSVDRAEAAALGRGGLRERLREIDGNGDGRWQVGEVELALHARIDAADRNRDGVIGEDERPWQRGLMARRG